MACECPGIPPRKLHCERSRPLRRHAGLECFWPLRTARDLPRLHSAPQRRQLLAAFRQRYGRMHVSIIEGSTTGTFDDDVVQHQGVYFGHEYTTAVAANVIRALASSPI